MEKVVLKISISIILSLAISSCLNKTDSKEIFGKIRNDCAANDARQVHLLLSLLGPVNCPIGQSLEGTVIYFDNAYILDSLKIGTNNNLIGHQCDINQICKQIKADVEILTITATEVTGNFQLFDTLNIKLGEKDYFKVKKCFENNLCG